MIIHLPLMIGFRYIRAKRRNQFISFVSLFSLIAMALGTLALILVLSVMNGFDKEIKQRVLSVVPNGFIDASSGQLDQWLSVVEQAKGAPHVEAVAPYIDGFAMLSHKGNLQSVAFEGIEPRLASDLTEINEKIVSGDLQFLEAGKYRIVLGKILANYLQLGVGDPVVMTLPQLTISPAGLFPRVKRFTVAGIFESGAQIDQRLAFIHIKDAQKLLRFGQSVSGLQVRLDEPYQAQSHMREIQLFSPFNEPRFTTRHWGDTQGGLFKAIQMEKRMVAILLMVIIGVAALNIITSLVLMVADKRKDIAVLRTLGMKPFEVMSIFVFQGTLVGFIGVLSGAILGCFLALYIGEIVAFFEQWLGASVFDPSTFYITKIPSELRAVDVVVVTLSGLIMSFIATLYPAYRATKVAPAEVLRYE